LPRAGGALSGALLVVSSSLARPSIQRGVSIGQCAVVAHGSGLRHPVRLLRHTDRKRAFRFRRGRSANRGPSRVCGLERVAGCGIIALQRNNSAHLHRPWRATSEYAIDVSRRPIRAGSGNSLSSARIIGCLTDDVVLLLRSGGGVGRGGRCGGICGVFLIPRLLNCVVAAIDARCRCCPIKCRTSGKTSKMRRPNGPGCLVPASFAYSSLYKDA
jgi:hypothetical protein